MATQINVGMTLKLQRQITPASARSLVFDRENAVLVRALRPGTGMNVVQAAAGPPVWVKLSIPGQPANQTLKMRGDEVASHFGYAGGVTIAPLTGMAKYRQVVEREGQMLGASPGQVKDFFDIWEVPNNQPLKILLAAIATEEMARTTTRFYLRLRSIFPGPESLRIMVVVAGLEFPVALKVMDHVARNWARIASTAKGMGRMAEALGLTVAAIEMWGLVAKGEYGGATAVLYKTAMGMAVKWSAAIDLLQAVLPENLDPRWLKALRAIDPIGLGGVGVEAMIWMVQSATDWLILGKPLDEERLGKLVDRMKQSPAAYFVELGERIPLDEVFMSISEMSDSVWQSLKGKNTPEMQQYLMKPRKYEEDWRMGKPVDTNFNPHLM